jgi:hypothetical protein
MALSVRIVNAPDLCLHAAAAAYYELDSLLQLHHSGGREPYLNSYMILVFVVREGSNACIEHSFKFLTFRTTIWGGSHV